MPAYRLKVSITVEAYGRSYETLEHSTTAHRIEAEDAQQAHQKATTAVRHGFHSIAQTADAYEQHKRAREESDAS